MNNDYEYRLLRRGDLQKLEDLFVAAFNTPTAKDTLKWKYFLNPNGDAILVGAFYDDFLVGSGAMIPERINYFGTSSRVFKCTDLMTHPEHQQKGISKRINSLLNEEVLKTQTPFSYTFCSQISTKSFIKNKWIFIAKIINLFKPYQLLKIICLFRKRENEYIKHFNTIDDLLDEYEFNNNLSGLSIFKEIEFIKWRTNNPGYTYRLLCHYNNTNKINGYLIYSISPNNMVNVIDFDLNCSKSVIINLFKELEFIVVINNHKGILIMALENSALYIFAKKNGYMSNPFKKGPLHSILDFNINLIGNSDKRLLNVKFWNFSALSYDDI